VPIRLLRALPAAAAAVALVASSPALAADLCKGGPRESWLTKDQLRAKLSAMGHAKPFLAVEDGCYEAKVVTAEGKRLEIYIDPVSGEVVKTKAD
jgi:hypothetical protein